MNMKKSLLSFFILATAIMMSSCQVENPVEEKIISDGFFTVNLAADISAPATKATLTTEDEKYFKADWEDGDVISLTVSDSDPNIDNTTFTAKWAAENKSFVATVPSALKDKTVSLTAEYPVDAETIMAADVRAQEGNEYNSSYDYMIGTIENVELSENATIAAQMHRQTAIMYFHLTSNIAEGIISARLTCDENEICAAYSDMTANDAILWFNVIPENYSGIELIVETEAHILTITNPNGLNLIAGHLYEVIGNASAKWANKGKTASFSVNGQIVSSQVGEVGASVDFPTADEITVPEGSSLIGWSLSPIQGTSANMPTLIQEATISESGVTYYAVFKRAGYNTWVKATQASDIVSGSTVALICYDESVYVPNATASNACPIQAAVTQTGDAIAFTEAMKWLVTGNNTDGFTFESKANAGQYLWGGSANDGTRVNTTSTKANATKNWFVKTKETYGLVVYNKATTDDRYLATYSTNDWRNYTSISASQKPSNIFVNSVSEEYFTFVKTLCSLELSGKPNKVQYTAGESLDPTGLVIIGKYNDGTASTITDGIEWTFDPETLSAGATSCDVVVSVGNVLSDIFTVTGLTVSEDENTTYSLTFPDSNKLNNKVQTYASTWMASNGKETWSITNFNNNNWSGNWEYIKCGNKNSASICTIITDEPLSKAIKHVSVTYQSVTANSYDEAKLYVADNATFSNAASYDLTISHDSKVATDISTPSANMYYKLEYKMKKVSTNGAIVISSIEYSTN